MQESSANSEEILRQTANDCCEPRRPIHWPQTKNLLHLNPSKSLENYCNIVEHRNKEESQ